MIKYFKMDSASLGDELVSIPIQLVLEKHASVTDYDLNIQTGFLSNLACAFRKDENKSGLPEFF